MGAAMWLQSIAGLLGICGLAWLASEDRPRRPWGLIAVGLGMQLLLALLLLRAPGFRDVIGLANDAVVALTAATEAGSSFVFGYLGGAAVPFEIIEGGSTLVIAFQVLTLVIVVSALTALLIHWRILPWIVRGFAALLERPFRLGGAAGLGMAANIFVGMVEAPLLVRPYLAGMSRSAMFAAMTTGMATVAGTVMALYALIMGPSVPGAAGHILAASIISAPAALMIAWIMIPEAADHEDQSIEFATDEDGSVMNAIAAGTLDGLRLLAYVAAMLIVMLALVALVNQILGLFTPLFGSALTVQGILGWLLWPVAWLIGIPWAEAAKAAELVGIKTVLNEFVAYLELANVPAEDLSARSRLIMTYALCGFANFGSLGILTGGLMAMVPERREDILSLGPKTLISGTLATLMTGAVVGLLTVN